MFSGLCSDNQSVGQSRNLKEVLEAENFLRCYFLRSKMKRLNTHLTKFIMPTALASAMAVFSFTSPCLLVLGTTDELGFSSAI